MIEESHHEGRVSLDFLMVLPDPVILLSAKVSAGADLNSIG